MNETAIQTLFVPVPTNLANLNISDSTEISVKYPITQVFA